MQPARILIVLGVTALCAAGCQQQPSVYASRDHLPAPAVEGRPRSLALVSPRMQRMPDVMADQVAWYDYRNDLRPTVYAGVESPTFDAVQTITFDREHSSFGRVHEHFSETRVRSRFRQTVR